MTEKDFDRELFDAGFNRVPIPLPRVLLRYHHPDTGDKVYEVPFGESFAHALDRILAERASEK